MRQFLLQRRLQSAGSAIVVSLMAFCFVPASGNPAVLLVPEQATPAEVAPYNPGLGRLADRHKPPGYVDATGGGHWLGTDDQDRDVGFDHRVGHLLHQSYREAIQTPLVPRQTAQGRRSSAPSRAAAGVGTC